MLGITDPRIWSERSSYLIAVSEESLGRDMQDSPSARSNTAAIGEVLAREFPQRGTILEIASGTGQHAVAFAGAFTAATWQPSDPDPRARASIAAWTAASGLDNIAPPLELDVMAPAWNDAITAPVAGMLCVNMLHISPWAATEGLMAGAGRLLSGDAPLAIYGAFKRGGRHQSDSNVTFDRSLRHRDPEWGVRDLEAVADRAAESGLALAAVHEMPSNNLLVVFRATGTEG